MKEKLVIKNFGPIKSVEIELSRFTVLIGEQATGKSTVAKLLAVCRYFSYIIDDHMLVGSPAIEISTFEGGMIDWGLHQSLQNDTYIQYLCEHYDLTIEWIEFEDEFIDPDTKEVENYIGRNLSAKISPKSRVFKNLLAELEKIRPKAEGQFDFSTIGWTIPTSFFQNEVSGVIDNPFYLPTERGLQSIFSIGKSSIQNISDSLFNQFAKTDQILRSFSYDIEVEPLNLVYKSDARMGGLIRRKDNDEYFQLRYSASGYQSTIPVVLVVKYYNEFRKKKKTIIIEEPELNLFPTAQKELVQFLVNQSAIYQSPFLITTHSPYTLAALNNLMAAFEAGKVDKVAAEGIIPNKYWLNHWDVSAYKLLSDGTCIDIFDREEGLIRSEEIDTVSTAINQEFDDLLNIQFKQK